LACAGGLAGALTPDDVGFYDDVRRSTDHDEVLGVVAPNQNKLSTAIDGAGLDYRKAWSAATGACTAERARPKSPDQPGCHADQREHHHESDKEADRKRGSFSEKAIHRTYRPP
jgi:hypothetical protein